MQWWRLDLTVPYLHVGGTTGALRKHTEVEKESEDSWQAIASRKS